MMSSFLPALFPADTVLLESDPDIQPALLPLVKRLGEQRSHRFGHMEHSEVELVLVRLDVLAKQPGFEDLDRPLLADWRIWYSLIDRRLDALAYRSTTKGTEVVSIPEAIR
jgi:hypothetical protein